MANAIATVAPAFFAITRMAFFIDDFVRLTIGSSYAIGSDAGAFAKPAFFIGQRIEFCLSNLGISLCATG